MLPQYRPVDNFDNILQSPSHTRGDETSRETTIALEYMPVQSSESRSPTASEREVPDELDRHSDTTPRPSTITHTSIEDSHLLRGHRERNGAEVSATTESEETHAWLDEDRSDDNLTPQLNSNIKGRRVKLLTAWGWEVASLTVAIAALTAIVFILAQHNNQEQPTWKGAINLNTLIAILSTLMRACMVVVAEEAVSQLKWMFFRQPRPLQTISHFDSASRGPWGSLILILRSRRINTALLGCVVIVLSVGVGPFTQQAVKAVSCERPLDSAEASIRVSRWMHSDNLDLVATITWEPNLDTKVAILDGLVSRTTTRSRITPNCSTGKCFFPSHEGVTHSSIAMCKKCVDIGPWVQEANSTRWGGLHLMLPNDQGIDRGGRPTTITNVYGHVADFNQSAAPFNNSILEAFDDSFKSIFRSSVLNVSVITYTNNGCDGLAKDLQPPFNCSNHDFETRYPRWDHANVVATACSFYPCVQDYHGSVEGTIFTETVVKNTPIMEQKPRRTNDYSAFLHIHTPCLINGQVYTMNNMSSVPKEGHIFTSDYVDQQQMTFPSDCAYGVAGAYVLSLVDFMSDLLSGNCTVAGRIGFNGNKQGYDAARCDPWYLKGLVNEGNASFESIDLNMESIATAITSEMRKEGGDYRNHGLPLYAKGTVLQTTVCTKFDWKWLSFPLGLTLMSILLLYTVCGKAMLDKQSIPAWKSSVLPLLLIGNQIGDVIRADEVDEIKRNTNNVVVSLAHLDKGWELVIDDAKKDS